MSECDICMTKKSKWSCDSCKANFCQDCMTLQNKPECSACNLPWKGTDPIMLKMKKIVKSSSIEKLRMREIKSLSVAQVYVDWMIEVEAIRKNLRFGICKPIPKKPVLAFETDEGETFACPKEDCRGFVTSISKNTNLLASMTYEEILASNLGHCGVCKDSVCLRCREISPAGHRCDEKTVQNIAEVRSTCKNCPRCNALIFKTSGCDHMFCTHCRGHFHWKTNAPLRNNQSTNGHQNQTEAFAKNVIIKNVITKEKNITDENLSLYCANRQKDDQLRNSVPKDTRFSFESSFVAKLWQKTFDSDFSCIRYFQKERYANAYAKQMDSLIDLRCKYLRKQIDDSTFYEKVFVLEEAYAKIVHEKSIVETILHVGCDLQQQASLSSSFADPFLHEFISFLGLLSKENLGKLKICLPTTVDPLPFLR